MREMIRCFFACTIVRLFWIYTGPLTCGGLFQAFGSVVSFLTISSVAAQ